VAHKYLARCSKKMALTTPLEIYLLTFNCARTLIDPTLLGASFFSAWRKQKTDLPDVVAVSLQEVAPIAYSFLGESWIAPYLQRVEDSLRVASKERGDGAAYERVATHSVGMTTALVFVKKELRSAVRSIETAGVGVGVWEMGNKGGVGIRLDVDATELTFVAMHLAPMEGYVERRNQDWQDICRGLVFRSDNSSGTAGTETEPLLAGSKRTASGLYKPKSHIFLFGDLNYRTSHLSPTETAHKTFPQPSLPDSSSNRIPLSELLTRDQLTLERQEGRTLHGFEEAPIKFPPTYKYSHSRSDVPGPQAAKGDAATADEEDDESAVVQEPSLWSWAKHRWPSWCDRILWYPPSGVNAGVYTALPLLPSSDHRPVALHITLQRGRQSEEVENDLRKAPPFALDEHWHSRRAAARRYEIVVGIASWFALTTEGQATVAGLIGGALAVYFLVQVFGQGVS